MKKKAILKKTMKFLKIKMYKKIEVNKLNMKDKEVQAKNMKEIDTIRDIEKEEADQEVVLMNDINIEKIMNTKVIINHLNIQEIIKDINRKGEY